MKPIERAATTARIEPMTDAAPLTAQAHETSASSWAPADAMTLGKTEPSGRPIAMDTRHAVAPRARSGHESVAAATRSNARNATVTTIALASAARATRYASGRSRGSTGAPTRSAASRLRGRGELAEIQRQPLEQDDLGGDEPEPTASAWIVCAGRPRSRARRPSPFERQEEQAPGQHDRGDERAERIDMRPAHGRSCVREEERPCCRSPARVPASPSANGPVRLRGRT